MSRALLGIAVAVCLGLFQANTVCAGDSAALPDTPADVPIGEHLVIIATVVGAVAALPVLIEFLIERRKRRERLALSIDVEPVESLRPRIAGLEVVLADMADLIDRAREPGAYATVSVGNEVLIIGPSLGGKKSLAQRVAKEAAFDWIITVYNPRNKDALARAKSLVSRYRRQRLMLLIPRIDLVFAQGDDDLLAELEALIETSAGRQNVLVVGTTVRLEPDSDLDNIFGTKVVLPGTPRNAERRASRASEETRRLLDAVARFYIREATEAGFRLVGLEIEDVVTLLLEHVGNPAEVEDVMALARTSAIHRLRAGKADDLGLTREIVDGAIARVIVDAGGT